MLNFKYYKYGIYDCSFTNECKKLKNKMKTKYNECVDYKKNYLSF